MKHGSVLLLLVALAACSSDSASTADSSATSSSADVTTTVAATAAPSSAPTTTVPPETTTPATPAPTVPPCNPVGDLPLDEPPTFDPPIRIGDCGGIVEWIQSWVGLPESEIDGQFGPITEQAVKDFQIANGMTPTGIWDLDTYSRLFPDPPPDA